jgi:acetoacetate decarboxylase
MGFVHKGVTRSHVDYLNFYDAEMIMAFFVTKQEVMQKILPPPLKPPATPLGYVFVANYPRTDFGVAYRESALYLAADFNGEVGRYCLSMPVTNDIALILGREVFGYPKKMANILMTHTGNEVEGWTERHGVRLLDLRAKLTGAFNDEAAMRPIKARLENNPDSVTFNYKFFQAPDGKGFDYNPRLVREVVRLSKKSVEFAEAEVVFRSSDHDPWGEVEIAKMLGAAYIIGDLRMLPGSVVAEVDQDEFAPYASFKIDALPAMVGDKSVFNG